MISDLKQLFSEWITAVVVAVNTIRARLAPQRRGLVTAHDDGTFQARLIAGRKELAKTAEVSFRLHNGRPEPALPDNWHAALRGSRMEVLLRPGRVLFRVPDFPRQAADFLDGMIRAQIDRVRTSPAAAGAFGVGSSSPITNRGP